MQASRWLPLLIVLLLAMLSVAACSDDGSKTDSHGRDGSAGLDSLVDDGGSPQFVDAGSGAEAGTVDAGAGDDGCQPTYTDCQGLCGNVTDPCTGQELSCGDCPDGEVCNPYTFTCMVPKLSCAALGAQCGLAKNSCGQRIDCGYCPQDQECDPDTNKCVPCVQVTCQDMGYECGETWLGCGSPSNTFHCGTCPTGKTCNDSFNICEPDCTPQEDSIICNTARATSGVECGFISNGCGGLADCGSCPEGEQCGIFGVANRCDAPLIPDECKVYGYTCGKVTSVCGGKIDCGTCPEGQSCTANHVCGPECQPKTCEDIAPLECGVVDNGCNGTLSCPCPSGEVCLPSGMCCSNTAKCTPGTCDTFVTDTCTGAQIECKCGLYQVCDKATKQCIAAKTCLSYNAGGTSSKCNDDPFYDRGDGVLIACPCQKPDWFCIEDSPTKEGSCCQNVNAPCPTSGPGSCNASVINSCTGEEILCTCPPDSHCVGDTCVLDDICASLGATGVEGAPCSNGPSPSFPDGTGGLLTCSCASGSLCLDANGIVVSGGDVGTCVAKQTCADYSATGNQGDPCSNDASPSFPQGGGVNLTCPCEASYACADPTDTVVSGGEAGICKPKKICAEYTTGAVGQSCNDDPFFSDGFGGAIPCPCDTTGEFANNTCEGDSPTQPGVCTCQAKACTCANSGTSDACGGTLDCPCPPSEVCNTSTATCCPEYTCSSLPPGFPAGACGTIHDDCMETSLSCSCEDPDKPNNACVTPSGQQWGACECEPDTCAELGVGSWPNDGCGDPITCSG